jgi:hypothetical protein
MECTEATIARIGIGEIIMSSEAVKTIQHRRLATDVVMRSLPAAIVRELRLVIEGGG